MEGLFAVFKLKLQVLRDLVDVLPLDAADPCRQDSGIGPTLVVRHPQDGDRATPQLATGKGGLVSDDYHTRLARGREILVGVGCILFVR